MPFGGLSASQQHGTDTNRRMIQLSLRPAAHLTAHLASPPAECLLFGGDIRAKENGDFTCEEMNAKSTPSEGVS